MPGRSGAACPSPILAKGYDDFGSLPTSGTLQRAVGPGEQAAAGGLDHHVVLDPDAAPARQVHPGLDRDDHALLQDRAAAGVEARVLVRLQAHAVADTVDETIGQPAGPDHGARGLVHLAG